MYVCCECVVSVCIRVLCVCVTVSLVLLLYVYCLLYTVHRCEEQREEDSEDEDGPTNIEEGDRWANNCEQQQYTYNMLCVCYM